MQRQLVVHKSVQELPNLIGRRLHFQQVLLGSKHTFNVQRFDIRLFSLPSLGIDGMDMRSKLLQPLFRNADDILPNLEGLLADWGIKISATESLLSFSP